jgi:aminoglycoside phosphotransferase (APT) family kinase protein
VSGTTGPESLASGVDIDLVKLGAWMDARSLGDAGAPVEAVQLSGGLQNVVYAVERGDFRAALRMPPPSAPPRRNDGIVREWRIIAGLRGTEVPHTEAIALCEDVSVLGRPFYLMGLIDGWSPMNGAGEDGRNIWPEPFGNDPGLRANLAYELIDALALLGKTDWHKPELEGLGRPDGFHERQVDRWLRFLERVRARELPGLDEAAAWLWARKPLDFVPGIMHGDYQFANVMFANGAPALLAAIVDWEMGTIGDPKLDLAWVVARWPEDTSSIKAQEYYVDLTGMPGASALVQRYGEVAGRQVDDIDYYVVLARWKLAIMLEQGFQRAAGNPEMARLGTYVLDLLHEAAELAESSSYKGP